MYRLREDDDTMTTNNSDVRAKLAYCVLGLEDTIKTAEEQKDATALYAKKTLTHAASLLLHDVEKYRKIVKLAGRLGGTRVGEVGTRGASPQKQQAKAANAKPTLLELFAEIAALGLHDCSDPSRYARRRVCSRVRYPQDG